MSARGDRTWRVVRGALESCINDHGPITTELIPSATKRVVAQLRQTAASLVRIEGDDLAKTALEEIHKKHQRLRNGHERALGRIKNLEAENAALRELVVRFRRECDPREEHVLVSAVEVGGR